MKKRIIVICILIVAVMAGSYWLFFQPKSSSLTLYGNVDIRSVNTSFQVPGRLVAMQKQEGDVVKQGDKLAEIDTAGYQVDLQKSQAALQASESVLAMLTAGYRKEDIAQAEAQVAQSQAAYTNALSNYARQSKLIKTGATSPEQLDNSLATRDQTNAALQAAKDKLSQLQSGYRVEEVDAAKADVLLAKANIAQAELNLNYTTLYAPSDGVILTRAVEPGTFLNAGITVYTISLSHPTWVVAYVDESNLGQAIPGRTVYLTTDSNPNKTYIGQIGFVSPTAEFTPKTVQTPDLRTDLVYRLRVVINQSGEGAVDDLLRQGMPVTIRFEQ